MIYFGSGLPEHFEHAGAVPGAGAFLKALPSVKVHGRRRADKLQTHRPALRYAGQNGLLRRMQKRPAYALALTGGQYGEVLQIKAHAAVPQQPHHAHRRAGNGGGEGCSGVGKGLFHLRPAGRFPAYGGIQRQKQIGGQGVSGNTDFGTHGIPPRESVCFRTSGLA